LTSGNGDSLSGHKDPENFIRLPDDYYDPLKFANDSIGTKAYNLSDALTVSNKSAPGPFEKDNSRFLSMSGTRDNEKGIESTDIAGMKHGVFTSALLQVYRSHPSTLPLFELMNQVAAIMGRQSYKQVPTFYYDPTRMNKNLLGINPSGFTEKLKAACISIKKGSIIIDKGSLSGVTRGNIFSDIQSGRRQKIRVTTVFRDSAIGMFEPGDQVRPGQVFELEDDHTISEPFIKLYIHAAPFTPAAFGSFFKKKIEPVTKQANYGDYNFSDDMRNMTIVIWKDASRSQKIENAFYPEQGNSLLYVVPPIPSFIAGPLKDFLEKDQNIGFVNDPAKADFAIYMNYAKSRDGNGSEFIFYFHPVISDTATLPWHVFSVRHVSVAALDMENISKIRQELYTQAKELIRSKTNAWMNIYPRK
jgi:hypothetical protein